MLKIHILVIVIMCINAQACCRLSQLDICYVPRQCQRTHVSLRKSIMHLYNEWHYNSLLTHRVYFMIHVQFVRHSIDVFTHTNIYNYICEEKNVALLLHTFILYWKHQGCNSPEIPPPFTNYYVARDLSILAFCIFESTSFDVWALLCKESETRVLGWDHFSLGSHKRQCTKANAY